MYANLTENEVRTAGITLAKEMQENGWKLEDITIITIIKHLPRHKNVTPENIDPIHLKNIKSRIEYLFSLAKKFNTTF